MHILLKPFDKSRSIFYLPFGKNHRQFHSILLVFVKSKCLNLINSLETFSSIKISTWV